MIKQNHGVTLMELMIVVAILAIVVSIAYPGYQSQMRENRRTDGQRILLEILQAQQKFYSRNSTYTTDLITDLNFTDAGGGNVSSKNEYYLVNAQACPSFSIEDCVLLTAVAQGSQLEDGDLTLDSRNSKTPASHW